MKSYQALANAIIEYAVKDYKRALKSQKRNPQKDEFRTEIASLERFFHSDWFQLLSSLEGDILINRIRQEVSR